jgi:hypothetical protein
MLWFWAAALTLIGLAWASVSSTSKLSPFAGGVVVAPVTVRL